jgi:hypothetical protein
MLQFIGARLDVELHFVIQLMIEAPSTPEVLQPPRQLFQPIHGDLYAVRITSWMASTSRSNCLDSRSSCFRPSGVSL